MSSSSPAPNCPSFSTKPIAAFRRSIARALTSTPSSDARLARRHAHVRILSIDFASSWGVSSEVHSVTNFSELARDAAAAQRWNRLHPLEPPRVSHVEQQLQEAELVVAATDYVRGYPQLIAPYVGETVLDLGH
jgi:pyruvate dehydrogenase complex dehydrogenase (E1) component